MADLYDQLLDLVPPELRSRPGAVLDAGRHAFTGTRKLYILGLNPGGDTGRTIQENIDKSKQMMEPWSRYALGKPRAGNQRFHRRVHHMLTSLDAECDPCTVPASNVVFVRSKRESDLAAEKSTLLEQCWPVHAEVIKRLEVRVIICLGKTAGKWVTEHLGARDDAGSFEEMNKRQWTSTAAKARDGTCVVTLTHPSIADWTSTATDPTPLVRQCLSVARTEAR